MTQPDSSLLIRIAERDDSALAELMRTYAPGLMRFATHYLRSPADADEVLQDVFVRAERAIRRGARPDRMDAWLFRITINRCRSRARRWWPFVSGASADIAISQAASPSHEGNGALREEIELALAALSPPLREAFLLKHVEGLDYQEMSGATGATIPALKMRVARAREQLRERLNEVRS